METLCQELEKEYHTLDTALGVLPPEEWNRVTPFAGWTIREEIGHIAYYDNKATLAVTDPMGFQAHVEEILKTCKDAEEMFERSLGTGRYLEPEELMALWKKERTIMLQALKALDPDSRHPWYGPPMTATSFATARLMETWAHGQDILDTLGIERTPTKGLEHICLLGVKTFGWAYVNRNLAKPADKVHVKVTGPDNETWSFGDEAWPNRVTGTALDFCLVVTQRRHVDDTGLRMEGDTAKEWMTIAQAFAGPPATGPQPAT
ncbi:MAG: TIGR03084 family protein [Desulfobacteraceae bacterium]|nr:TIGR03084 family protein [Desulfobacteraceae bacterium]